MIIYENPTEFVKTLINRADKSKNVIVGLGVQSPTDCEGFVMKGIGSNYIRGYFYKNGKFTDSFRIDHSFGSAEDAERHIREIRKVTKIFYY